MCKQIQDNLCSFLHQISKWNIIVYTQKTFVSLTVFFSSHFRCLDFLPERDINCNILNHIFPCFADSAYSKAAYPAGPSPVFYCCYYFGPSVRVFGLGRSWIPCPSYTQNFIYRREMCRWQRIFIHFSRARERRAAKPSWREKFAQRTKKNNNKRKKERLLFV